MTKTFKDRIQKKAINPTLQFISAQEPEEDATELQTVEDQKPGRTASTATSTPHKAPQARRALSQFDEETKSRRLQLLLTPSLYEAVKAKAAEERLSVNEYINATLKAAVRK